MHVAILVINKLKLYSPMKRIRLMKNRTDIFQYIDKSLIIALFLFLIDQQNKDIGIPNKKIIES